MAAEQGDGDLVPRGVGVREDLGLQLRVGEADVLGRQEVREDVQASVVISGEGRVMHELAKVRDVDSRRPRGACVSPMWESTHQRQVGLGTHGGTLDVGGGDAVISLQGGGWVNPQSVRITLHRMYIHYTGSVCENASLIFDGSVCFRVVWF